MVKILRLVRLTPIVSKVMRGLAIVVKAWEMEQLRSRSQA